MRRNTKVKFDYAVITQADILKGLHPTDQELKAFYDGNKARYNNSIPEKRQIKYALIDSAKIGAATPVTDAGPAGLLRPASRRIPSARASESAAHPDQDAATGPDGKEDEKGIWTLATRLTTF